MLKKITKLNVSLKVKDIKETIRKQTRLENRCARLSQSHSSFPYSLQTFRVKTAQILMTNAKNKACFAIQKKKHK